MYPTLTAIRAMSPIAQAKFWVSVEDELLLDIDLGIGHGVTETDPVRIEAARRLEDAGIVVMRPGVSPTSVIVDRVFPVSTAQRQATGAVQ